MLLELDLDGNRGDENDGSNAEPAGGMAEYVGDIRALALVFDVGVGTDAREEGTLLRRGVDALDETCLRSTAERLLSAADENRWRLAGCGVSSRGKDILEAAASRGPLKTRVSGNRCTP